MLISSGIQRSLVTDLNLLVAGSKMETKRQKNINKTTKKSSEKTELVFKFNDFDKQFLPE